MRPFSDCEFTELFLSDGQYFKFIILISEHNVLHRDISIGNALISEDEEEGFLVDLDYAIKFDSTENSGAKRRTNKLLWTPLHQRFGYRSRFILTT
ncbi:hypothetical protein BDD12DRAFT_833155 [Trichophaea hybrida]|nr:hypothetical protein BDD12DRAFT_833155 [Trichophaea hybrida]